MESTGQQFRGRPDRTMSDAHATLVLIHGPLDESLMWEHQIRCLSPDARVVTPGILEPESVGEAADRVLASVDDCGHYAPMKHPWATTALLQQWLRYP